MKSILKQVLTVVLLLSVPAVFAAEQKRAAEVAATGFVANAKAKASKAGQYVAGKSKAAYNYVADSKAVNYAKETRVVKALAKAQEKAAAKFYAHVWKEGSSKLANGARTTALVAVTGALAYGIYKLSAKAVKAAKAKLATLKKSATKPVVTKQTEMPVAPVVKTGPTAEQLAAIKAAKANVSALENLPEFQKRGSAFPGMLNDAKAQLAAAQLAAAAA